MADLLDLASRSTRAIIVIRTPQMIISAINEPAIELFGRNTGGWVGRQASNLFRGADKVYATIGLGALSSGALDSFCAHGHLTSPADAEVWICARLLQFEGGEVVVVEVAIPVDRPRPLDGVEEELSSVPSLSWASRPAIGGDPGLEAGLRDSATEVLDRLPERQREIVTALLQGARVTEIAAALYVSKSTVRSHLSSIFVAFGVHSQTELLTVLRSLGKVHHTRGQGPSHAWSRSEPNDGHEAFSLAAAARKRNRRPTANLTAIDPEAATARLAAKSRTRRGEYRDG